MQKIFKLLVTINTDKLEPFVIPLQSFKLVNKYAIEESIGPNEIGQSQCACWLVRDS